MMIHGRMIRKATGRTHTHTQLLVRARRKSSQNGQLLLRCTVNIGDINTYNLPFVSSRGSRNTPGASHFLAKSDVRYSHHFLAD